MEFRLPIEDKSQIGKVILFSQGFDPHVLRVVPGTAFDDLKGHIVTVSLIARCPVDQDYMIGHSNLKVVIADADQEAPMLVNHPMLEREESRFRNNGVYTSYVICIDYPCVQRPWQKYGTMAPYATPNSL